MASKVLITIKLLLIRARIFKNFYKQLGARYSIITLIAIWQQIRFPRYILVWTAKQNALSRGCIFVIWAQPRIINSSGCSSNFIDPSACDVFFFWSGRCKYVFKHKSNA